MQAMSSESGRSPAAKAMDEAIDLAIEGHSRVSGASWRYAAARYARCMSRFLQRMTSSSQPSFTWQDHPW